RGSLQKQRQALEHPRSPRSRWKIRVRLQTAYRGAKTEAMSAVRPHHVVGFREAVLAQIERNQGVAPDTRDISESDVGILPAGARKELQRRGAVRCRRSRR